MSPLDFMPTSLIKDCSDVFASLICRFAICLFKEGVFPDIFKVDQITHLIKSQIQMSVNHQIIFYRPIINLNIFGKILERLALNQLRQHLSTSPDYDTSQPAYRALHLTETALTKVVNDLLTAVDNGKPTVLLSLDINAAFDILNHESLLNSTSELFGYLDHSCFQCLPHLSVVLSLHSTCYVTNTQMTHSCIHPLICCKTTTWHLVELCWCSYQLYTSIDLSSDHDIENSSITICCSTHQTLRHWSQAHGNRSWSLKIPHGWFERYILLTRVQSPFAYLHGVTINRLLINTWLTLCSRAICLRHIRSLTDKDTATILVCSIVTSRLDYCNAVLYGTSENADRLQRVQNSLVRGVCNASYRSSS